MINSKQDYRDYLEADRRALGRSHGLHNWVRDLFFPDYIWRFQRLLRRVEYHKNLGARSIASRVSYVYWKRPFRRLSMQLGFTIPENVFGPGLAIVHYGTIVVNEGARVGANCRIHPGTTIGASAGGNRAPRIGDNVYFAPGVKVFGDIVIASNTAIGANAVVTESFAEENTMLAGVPARRIKTIDIRQIIRHLNERPC